MLRRIGVFAGASLGSNPAFGDAARELGCALAQRGITLVVCGSVTGLLQAVVQSSLDFDGSVVHVVDRASQLRGVPTYGQVLPAEDPHVAKQIFYYISDGFIALPGGLEVFDGLTEVPFCCDCFASPHWLPVLVCFFSCVRSRACRSLAGRSWASMPSQLVSWIPAGFSRVC